MNKVLVSLVLISLIYSGFSTIDTGTCNTARRILTADLEDGNGYWDRPDGVSGRACSSTACDTPYASVSHTAGFTANCNYCATGYNFNKLPHLTCVQTTANCADGYASAASGETAGKAASDCDLCATGYHFDTDGQTCIADGTACTSPKYSTSALLKDCVATNTDCADNYASNNEGTTLTATGASCTFCDENSHRDTDEKTCIADGDLCTVGKSDSYLNTNCVAAGANCAEGYASSEGVITAGTAQTGAHCTLCADGYFFDSTVAATKKCAKVCAEGFYFGSVASDSCIAAGAPCTGNSASSATVTNAGTAQTGAACSLCASDFSFGNVQHTTCVSSDGACSTGYSSTSEGTGVKASDGCNYCATNYFWTSPLNSTCVLKNTACDDGYTSDPSGIVATTGTTATGASCVYCAKDTYWKDGTNTVCGTSCTNGWYTADGKTTTITAHCTTQTAPPTTSGHIMMISLALLSLLAIFI